MHEVFSPVTDILGRMMILDFTDADGVVHKGFVSNFIDLAGGIIGFFGSMIKIMLSALYYVVFFISNPTLFVSSVLYPALVNYIKWLVNASVGWTVLIECIIIGESYYHYNKYGPVSVCVNVLKDNFTVIKWFFFIVIFGLEVLVKVLELTWGFIQLIYHLIKGSKATVPLPGM